MKIGELAQRSGFSMATIRWYEKIGLMGKGKVDRSFNNYRDYDEESLVHLQKIKKVKALGFTLKEIELLMDLEANEELTCEHTMELFSHRLLLIDQKIAQLTAMRSKLRRAQTSCTGNCGKTIF